MWRCLLLVFSILVRFSDCQPQLQIQQNLCLRDIEEDICPQREGFDVECDRKCSASYPMRIGSGCRTRQTGTLLSFFGIRSFVCTCHLSPIVCANPQLSMHPFQYVFIQQHSTLLPIPQSVEQLSMGRCEAPMLTCHEAFDAQKCSWKYSKEFQWYTAHPNGSPMPRESPNGTYLAGTSITGDTWATISTCDGLCSKTSMNFTAKVWRPPTAIVELCFKEKDTTMCAPVHSSNGHLINEIIPETEYFQIMLRFSNVTAGEMVLIDELAVDYTPCKIPQTSNTAQLLNSHQTLRINQIPQTQYLAQRKEPPSTEKLHSASHMISGGHYSTGTKICVGRPGLAYCRQKCKALDVLDNSAKCVRQKDNPLVKKCICHVRRSPLRRIEILDNEVDTNKVSADEITTKMDIITTATTTPMPTTTPSPPLQNYTSLTCDPLSCLQKCGAEKKMGKCSSTSCECFEKEFPQNCEENICSFEKNTKCGWADLRMLSRHFNNISVAMKKGDENRYGISRLRSHSYSGLLYKSQLIGPISMSIDVFPSHEIDVRICVQNLRKCQTQTITARSWNRVSARIKVHNTEKIFVLFYNSSDEPKSLAIDNIVVQTGPCS